MNITPKIRQTIYRLFDDLIKGADKYVTTTSMWFIFTDEKRWVIEFTDSKTLWFNYNMFQTQLGFVSMNCVHNKDIIKEWFESRFLDIEEEVTHVTDTSNVPLIIIEKVVQNGVKDTHTINTSRSFSIEDTIQNGVKEINHADVMKFFNNKMDKVIQNGVKCVKATNYFSDNRVMETIQSGVKDIRAWNFNMRQSDVEDTIENGVKETKYRLVESWEQKDHMVTNSIITEKINDAIENGVKEVKTPGQ